MRNRHPPAACIAAVVGILVTGGCVVDGTSAVTPSLTSTGVLNPAADEPAPEDAGLHAVSEALDVDLQVAAVSVDSASGGFIIKFLGDHDQRKIDRATRALEPLGVPLTFDFLGDGRMTEAHAQAGVPNPGIHPQVGHTAACDMAGHLREGCIRTDDINGTNALV
jgi:hypothetical protein